MMNLYKSAAEIDRACVLFFKSGQKLQTEAHRLACSVLAHVGEHGDIRVVSKFLASFPEMSRVNAVRSWFEAFGPITFQGNNPSYVKGGKTRLGEALDTPFYKFSPEPDYKPVNANAEVEKLIKKLLKDTKILGTDHSGLISGLKMLRVNAAQEQNTPVEEQFVPLMIEYQPTAH
jgi:hypothetical protein